MMVFLCHKCHVATEPTDGASGGFCDRCGGRCTHFITWKSPEEDAAAKLLIERELERASGGWGGTYRAEQALKDTGITSARKP